MKYLIVNADDFGLSHGINEGIVEAHERGIVTSASLMVRQPAAAQAAAYARLHPRLGLGLHIDLWEQVWRDDQWVRLYAHVADDADAIAQEVRVQLDAFRALVGRDPDHLDTHQHVHRREPVRTIVAAVSRELGLPLRGDGTARYVGGFYGQDDIGGPYPEGIGVPRLIELLDALQPGTTVLGCHPGCVAADDPLGGTVYRFERNTERRTLCDARVRERVVRGDIALVNHATVALPGGQADGTL